MEFDLKEIEPILNSLKRGDVIIEIGGERGEHSTKCLSELAGEYGLEFHSIDIEETVFRHRYGNVITHIADGAEFLKTFDKKIRFAYLDNFYWLFYFNREVLEQIMPDFDAETNNKDSMETHLQQAIQVNRLSDNPCFIMFDDTWRTQSGFDGKGGTAVPYLLDEGYKVIGETTNSILLKK